MKITLDIADDVLALAKKRAADDGVTLQQIVESALRAFLAAGAERRPYQLNWKTEHGVLQPGVNLDDRNALFDRMDSRD